MHLFLLSMVMVASLVFYSWLEWVNPRWLIGGPIRRAIVAPLMAPAVVMCVVAAVSALPFLIFICLFSKDPWEAQEEAIRMVGDVVDSARDWFTSYVWRFIRDGNLFD